MKIERELLKGIGPLVVLEMLSRRAMYGYELAEAVSKRSNEVLSLGRGTLYPLLYNLEGKKLIEGEWRQSGTERRRRYYRLTAKGKVRLATQKDQWIQMVRGVNAALEIGSSWIAPA